MLIAGGFCHRLKTRKGLQFRLRRSPLCPLWPEPILRACSVKSIHNNSALSTSFFAFHKRITFRYASWSRRGWLRSGHVVHVSWTQGAGNGSKSSTWPIRRRDRLFLQPQCEQVLRRCASAFLV